TKDMFIQNGQPRQDLANAGPLAVAVPAATKGYVELAKRFGTKPLSQLTSAAELIAQRGFQVDLHFHRAAEERLDCLLQDPESTRLFLNREKEPLEPGDRLIQPELAWTRRRSASWRCARRSAIRRSTRAWKSACNG